MADTVQLSVDDVPVEIISMLDAVSMAEGDKGRGALVKRILLKWARQKAREHSLIAKVMRGNQAMEDLAMTSPD